MNTTIDDIDDIVISAEAGGDWEKTPIGDHQAVLCDLQDLGLEEEEYKGVKKNVHKVLLVFQLECENGERSKDGGRFTIRKKFTRSLYETARLRKFLDDWRGRPFTEPELKDFRLKSLYGLNCRLVVAPILRSDGKGDYHAISSISKWNTKFGPEIKPENYVREEYKKKNQTTAAPTSSTSQPNAKQPDDDTVPF